MKTHTHSRTHTYAYIYIYIYLRDYIKQNKNTKNTLVMHNALMIYYDNIICIYYDQTINAEH